MNNIITKFRMAIIASRHSNFENRRKMGAVIIKNNRILSIGYNTNQKTHPQYASGIRVSIHAEISAIIHAESDINGASLFIYRNNNALAKPCPACIGAMIEARIRRAYYTTGDNNKYNVIQLR